jgi:hypothetical protein
MSAVDLARSHRQLLALLRTVMADLDARLGSDFVLDHPDILFGYLRMVVTLTTTSSQRRE